MKVKSFILNIFNRLFNFHESSHLTFIIKAYSNQVLDQTFRSMNLIIYSVSYKTNISLCYFLHYHFLVHLNYILWRHTFYIYNNTFIIIIIRFVRVFLLNTNLHFLANIYHKIILFAYVSWTSITYIQRKLLIAI